MTTTIRIPAAFQHFRRLRRSEALRRLVAETRLNPSKRTGFRPASSNAVSCHSIRMDCYQCWTNVPDGMMSPMGMTYVTMQVANAATPERTETLDFLVDSGANYSVVPSQVLSRLGIEPFSEDSFFLAGGQKITRKRGVAVFKYQDRIGGADVIFGEDGDENLLGALTFEALGLGLDPLRRRLFELPLMLASENPL